VRHQREAHSSNVIMSPAVHKEMRSVVMGEETLSVDEVPTAAEAGGRRRDWKCELDELPLAINHRVINFKQLIWSLGVLWYNY